MRIIYNIYTNVSLIVGIGSYVCSIYWKLVFNPNTVSFSDIFYYICSAVPGSIRDFSAAFAPGNTLEKLFDMLGIANAIIAVASMESVC